MSQRRPAGRPGRVVIRAEDPRLARDLQSALAVSGIDAVAVSGGAATGPAPGGEDITLIDGDGAEPAQFAKTLRRQVGLPLTIVAATRAAPSARGVFDGWLLLTERPVWMRRTLDDLRRDAVRRDELRARRRTSAELGLPAAPSKQRPERVSALYVGPPNTAFLAFEHAWKACGGAIGASLTSFAAFDHLHDETFGALAVNAIDNLAAATALIDAIERTPGLYHLPLMALAPSSATEDEDAWERANVLALKNEDLAAPAAWLHEAALRGHDRRTTVDLLKRIPEPSGLWTFATWRAHLDTLAGIHHAAGRPLSIASMMLKSEGADARARFHELAGLTARLIRVTDSLALAGEERLVAAFPGADLDDARTALTRVRSAWRRMAVATDEAPVRVEADSFELAPGESGAALFARAARA